MGGDLGGQQRTAPKFKVEVGPCLRPPNILDPTIAIVFQAKKVGYVFQWWHDYKGALAIFGLEKLKFLSKKGHSEIWLEKFVDILVIWFFWPPS